MAEIRMEVVCEEEAIEFCRCNGWDFIKCYEGKGSNHGRLMMLAETTESGFCSKEEEEYYLGLEFEDTVIFTMCNGGRLYLADTKKAGCATTFNLGMAKRFKNSTASIKVKNMNKHNGYRWQLLHVGNC